MTIGEATMALKNGHKVRRQSWAPGTYVKRFEHVVRKFCHGSSYLWECSNDDQSADDWEVLT
jgi:hypothetical protein